MKTYQNFGIYDFSDYAEEITGAALFKINGGAQVENSNEGVASAQVGDTIIRNDGTEVTLTQGDITWAQEQVGAGGNSGNTGSTGVNSQGSTNSNYQGSSSGQTGGEEKHQDEETSYNYNPNEPDSDKRYNAKDYNGKHLMTIRYDDKENFEDFAGYYTIIGQYGTVGSKTYDGIGLTDKDGNIIHVLKDEGAVQKYAEYLNPNTKKDNKNILDTAGNVSTASSLMNNILDLEIDKSVNENAISKMSKLSTKLAIASNITGGIATVKDIYDLNKEPTFLNYTNIVSDAVSFIPEIGTPMSIAISGCCELINKGVNLGLDVEAPILKREIMMNNFMKNTNMSTNILDFGISNTDVKILMNNTFRTFFKE